MLQLLLVAIGIYLLYCLIWPYRVIWAVKRQLPELLRNVDEAHDANHAIAVWRHAVAAIAAHKGVLMPMQKLAIQLAALLHDVDDHKFFNTVECANARRVMKELGLDQELISQVVHMIDLVSASRWGNDSPPNAREWELYPRYADRIESVGVVGVKRCLQYTQYTKRPFFLESTERCHNLDELYSVATPERYTRYVSSGGKSESMIAHYYDKLLHLANSCSVSNQYLRQRLEAGHRILEEVCLDFGRQGTINEAVLAAIMARSHE